MRFLTKHLFWIFAVLAVFSLLCRAWAGEDCDLFEQSRKTACLQGNITQLEKRVEDLETNLAAQVAKPCACTAPAGNLTDIRGMCEDKTRRFRGTNATPEAKSRFIDHCVEQHVIRDWRDP